MNNRSEKSKHQAIVTLLFALALLLGACSSTQSVGSQLDDGLITSKVKMKLAADPAVNPFEIDVDTREGVVYLSGMVDSWDERMEAEQLARATAGVIGVANELNIGEHSLTEELDDARIASKVKAKLVADPDINAFDIDVDIDLGVVTLRGLVETSWQKREAAAIARNTIGVKKVRNNIAVAPVAGS